jgi:hypothetical protein
LSYHREALLVGQSVLTGSTRWPRVRFAESKGRLSRSVRVKSQD